MASRLQIVGLEARSEMKEAEGGHRSERYERESGIRQLFGSNFECSNLPIGSPKQDILYSVVSSFLRLTYGYGMHAESCDLLVIDNRRKEEPVSGDGGT